MSSAILKKNVFFEAIPTAGSRFDGAHVDELQFGDVANQMKLPYAIAKFVEHERTDGKWTGRNEIYGFAKTISHAQVIASALNEKYAPLESTV